MALVGVEEAADPRESALAGVEVAVGGVLGLAAALEVDGGVLAAMGSDVLALDPLEGPAARSGDLSMTLLA